MMLNKIIIQILDFLIKIFTFLRKYFLRNNQEVKVIKLTRITYNNNLSCLNFFFNNNGNIIGSEEILKSIYYQLISQDEYINLGQYKVLMLIGSYKGIEFTYHHNILVNNTTSFEEYYAAIKNNIFKLYSEGYEVHDVTGFNMRV